MNLSRSVVLLVLAGLTDVSASATAAPECFVQCEAGSCEVTSEAGAVAIAMSQTRRVGACATARLTRGDALRGLVMTDAGVKQFGVTNKDRGRPFADVARHLFARTHCLGLYAACAESRDRARVAAIGGKGIDGVASRRVGSPCAMGLPCGSVLLPSAPAPFTLVDWTGDGSLVLSAKRGVGGATLDVRQGRVPWGPAGLAAGQAFAYSLRDAAGNEVAAGEFEVLSARMQKDAEADLVAAKGDLFGEVEAMLANDLAWDAAMRIR